MKYLLIAAVATTTLLVGCGKSVDVEGRGMYMNANSGDNTYNIRKGESK